MLPQLKRLSVQSALFLTDCRLVEPTGDSFGQSAGKAFPNLKLLVYTVVVGIRGKGTFVGVTLASGMNGNNTCWVEGEAKMYIDGDEYPTLNYTGQRATSADPMLSETISY